ncbi:hypothetical protein NEMBOFW57_007644 [Staphylotrichum longicolle]|uniref:Uncharacterized protein n=1 Tax=Staphylotrichum longicolle TaxID=669026 RepID=A0AAD4HYN3_9PEZI|nr:hypothetical protein NEMBOFW57_007644 [Staphylotrichum longicolle]
MPLFSFLPIIAIMTDAVCGLLKQYANNGQLLDVPMGEALFVDFRQMAAIGTHRLGSCSVAMVVSEHGAILAHIPPLPSPMSDDELSRRRGGTAGPAGHHAGPLSGNGLEPAIHYYVVPGDLGKLGKGTVMAISLAPGTYPAIYVEDSPVNHHYAFADGGTSSSTGEAAATAPATLMQAGFAPGTGQAGGSIAAPERMWREVRVDIVRHRTRRDEYVFRNAQNQRVSTDRADWHVAQLQGRAVWAYQGRETAYYTYQKIRQ